MKQADINKELDAFAKTTFQQVKAALFTKLKALDQTDAGEIDDNATCAFLAVSMIMSNENTHTVWVINRDNTGDYYCQPDTTPIAPASITPK